MFWLFTSLLLAAELPERPAPPAPIDGECVDAHSLEPGQSVDCKAVAMPLSAVADLLAVEKYADYLFAKSKLLLAEQYYESRLAKYRIEYLETELTVARQPIPVLKRTEVHLAMGVLGGIAVTIGAGFALSEVSK